MMTASSTADCWSPGRCWLLAAVGVFTHFSWQVLLASARRQSNAFIIQTLRRCSVEIALACRHTHTHTNTRARKHSKFVLCRFLVFFNLRFKLF